MNVLSLCDGMSCGQIALRELGIGYGKYYASEIDKFCIKQTQHNFPETIQLGDMAKWREWDIDWSNISLVLSGTPCQGFSFAGRRLSFNDPRSSLFFTFVDILRYIHNLNPGVRFLFENVFMKKQDLRVINKLLGLYPVYINSALVSAQNRRRYYWSNIRMVSLGLFEEIYTDVPLPDDRGIILADILQPEEEVDEKYFISQKAIDAIAKRHKNFTPKINPLKTGTVAVHNFHKQGLDNGMTFITVVGKAPTQRSATGRSLPEKHNYQIIQLNNSTESNGCQPYQQDRIYGTNYKSPAVLAGMPCGSHAIKRGNIRRLTPLEVARLQTVPDWYKWIASDSQIYKMCGNGWTIEVIKHILSFLPENFFSSNLKNVAL